MPRANPEIHGMMAYGYSIEDNQKVAIYHTSWGSGESLSEWKGDAWQAQLPVRGVIGFHPKPKITSVTRTDGNITVLLGRPRVAALR